MRGTSQYFDWRTFLVIWLPSVRMMVTSVTGLSLAVIEVAMGQPDPTTLMLAAAMIGIHYVIPPPRAESEGG
jgi:hypothetical protein